MKILYLGDLQESSTSFHRYKALCRLGHVMISADPYQAFKEVLTNPVWRALHFRTGYKLIQKDIFYWLENKLKTITSSPDIIWIDSGELIGPKSLDILKQLHSKVVLYNVDDPTGNRDGQRFNSLKKAMAKYDLIVVVREESKEECQQLGAKKVLRVFRSYDEIAHKPFDDVTDIPDKFRSDVAFIGTWMRGENRDLFLLDLINEGIDVNIWGDRWEKSRYWKRLQPHHRGGALGGREYVAAIQGAKICIGLLSKGNRDLHTQRSLEVPFAGGLLCAERTTEHMWMYKESEEAVFWSDSTECAVVCKQLLQNDEKREEIRLRGMLKVRSMGARNEIICSRIIEALS